MIRAIDHIVILVNDLDAAIDDYSTLGFTVVRGGEHAGGATHNALVAFEDGSYLELIAFLRPDPDHRWWRYAESGEGLIDFALLPDDIEATIAEARQRGLELAGPVDGGRLRPDGQRIAWRTGHPATSDLPFLCADVTPRDLRVPGGEARHHPNGVVGLASVTVAVDDLEASTARYRALLGNQAQQHAQEVAATPDAYTMLFRLDSAMLILAMPGEGSHGPLRDQLAHYGEGPYALVLRGGPGSTPMPLDQAHTHGARISIAPA